MTGEEKHHNHHRNNYQHHRRHQHHHLLNFDLHMPHLGHEKGTREARMVPPKGWMGIRVGKEGEEQQRFEVPVEYLNHPLFVRLLALAEKEYGFEQKGAITIPCGIDHFRHVQSIINRDTTAAAAAAAAAAHHHNHHHPHGRHHQPHFAGCFRA